MTTRIEEKKHLSARSLLKKVRQVFDNVNDPNSKNIRNKNDITLSDCLMSGLAMFSMKYPSMLQFDLHKNEEIIRHNLHMLYQIKRAPCDTYLRERLDAIQPRDLRRAFTQVFSELQRGKVLEKYACLNGHYLLLCDGTGFFSSKEVYCKNCCEKYHRNGSVTYYHMMLGAVIAHPDFKEVIPLCPEPIMKIDGVQKNDCERNACKRLLSDVRREHPHLPLIIVEDGLASNVPHLRLCQKYNIRFITVVKPDGNKSLFEWLKGLTFSEHTKTDEKGNCIHKMRYYNGIPLNYSDTDLEVNFIEYWEYDSYGNQKYHNTWVTDLKITDENVFQITRGGRARWKIENETFNTLKNQGYNFEHNYGHGNNNLSTVLAMLMMLGFLIDQVQQLCCGLFQAAWGKMKTKKSLWDRLKAIFTVYLITSWKNLYEAVIYGIISHELMPNTS